MTRIRAEAAETFRSLRHRNFRLYFVSQAISFTGTWLQLIAQALLVYRLTDSGTALGWLVGIQFAPALILGAWAGVVVDRHDKRRLIQLTTSVMLLAALALGVLVLIDQVTIAWVYGLAAVLGLANTFDNPARRTLVNELVPEEEISNAVSLNSTLVTSARLIGPALAGALVATVGIGWCFVVNAVSFIAPLVAVRRMDPASMRLAAPVARQKGQLRSGFRYVWSVPEIRVTLLMMAVIGTFGFNQQVLFPPFADRDLGGTDTTFAWLSATASLGMLLGSLWLARRRSIDTHLVGASGALFGVATVIVAVSPTVAVALFTTFLYGLTAVGVMSGSNSVLQLAAEPAMRGRVLALYTVVFLGSTPIGGPIMGFVVEHYSARAGLALAGGLSFVAALAGLAAIRGRLAVPGTAPVASSVALGADGTSAAA